MREAKRKTLLRNAGRIPVRLRLQKLPDACKEKIHTFEQVIK